MSGDGDEKTGRRGFLTALGLTAAGGAVLGGCDKGDPYSPKKNPVPGGAAWMHGQEKRVPSVCGMCPAGCGIQVRVVEGRAVKIDGHPGCPINGGSLGPKGQTGLQLLYHKDRLRGPLKRDGERGSGRWTPISWDAAIAEIAGRLRDLRARGPQGLVVADGDPRGPMREFWDRFLAAYGSPNHLDHHSATDGGKILAMHYMHGAPELPAYDWTRTQYVLGFGASLFESWCQSIHFTRASSQLRRGLPGKRVKFVQVSPRHSATAMKSDEWVALEPATYGALALGLGHVLVREKLHDEAFVREHTFGFEEWKDAAGVTHRGFRDLLLKDYDPEKVAGITGVPVKTIERLAHEMAEHRPAIALADGAAAAATNGLGTAMSIHALNALLGNLERPGGMIVQKQAPLAPWPALEADDAAKRGLATPRIDGSGGETCLLGRGFIQGVPEAVLKGGGGPVEALLLYKSNPVYAKPDGARWIEAIRKIPLVVSFSPLPDESTLWADYVLPESTYFERWDLVEPVPSVGYPVVTLRQPVVETLYDTLPTGDVILRLAKAIGAPLADAFPWDSYRKAIEDRMKGLLNAAGSSTVATKLADLRKGIEKEGAWWQGPYAFEAWTGAFPTPSGKFEFYSQEIARRLSAVPDLDAKLKAMGVRTRGDDLCLPHWEPPRFGGDPSEFPFVVAAYRGIEYAEGGVRPYPGLRELPHQGRFAWKEVAELNPEDAERLGIHQGHGVRVETTAGSRRLVARLDAGIRPGTIGIPLGYGTWPPAPSEKGTTGGYGLLANLSDPLGGILALQGTRARVRKEEKES